jgi:hypothetical protein
MSEEVPDYLPFVTGGYDLRYRFSAGRGDVKRSAQAVGPREGSARIPESPPSSERLGRRDELRRLRGSSGY